MKVGARCICCGHLGWFECVCGSAPQQLCSCGPSMCAGCGRIFDPAPIDVSWGVLL